MSDSRIDRDTVAMIYDTLMGNPYDKLYNQDILDVYVDDGKGFIEFTMRKYGILVDASTGEKEPILPAGVTQRVRISIEIETEFN